MTHRQEDTTWFLKPPQGQKIFGPFSLKQIQEQLQAKNANRELLISQDRMQWRRLEQVIPQRITSETFTDIADLGEIYFGEYRLQSQLGRGGMGLVFRAIDTRINRPVALKILMDNTLFGDAKQVEKFRKEAELTATLDHPNIVKLHGFSVLPQPHFTMELVEGKPLSDLLKQEPMPIAEAAQLFAQICAALEYAHRQKVLHRDIKPSNILLTKNGEPKVLDFGLARRITAPGLEEITQQADFAGTPKYIAPEQAAGDPPSRTADIYSLGAMFYQMLTGRTPFEGNSVMKILAQLVSEEPIPLRKLNPDVPVDLEVICLTCLEKKPRYRYQAVGGLRRDVEKFLQNKPISRRPPGVLRKTLQWGQRNRIVTAVGSTILVLAVFFLVYFVNSLLLGQRLGYELYQKGCNLFHHKDFANARNNFHKAKSNASANTMQLYWMEGAMAFIQGKDNADKHLREALNHCNQPRERCKLHLLLALAILDSNVPNKTKLADVELKKAKQQFVAAGEQWHEYEGYKTKIGGINRTGSRLDFKIPPFDEPRNTEKAHYYTIMALLPQAEVEEAHRQTYVDPDKRDQQIATSLASEMHKIWYLFSEESEERDEKFWVRAFLAAENPPRFAEVKEMAFFIEGKWILDMASPYWTHLPFEKQARYAALYQECYARQINKDKERDREFRGATFKMALIPPGQFLMGHTLENDLYGPRHPVVIPDFFWMCKYEVTQKQWEIVTGKSKKQTSRRSNPSYKNFFSDEEDSPIVLIFLDDIQKEFLENAKENIILPTEAQWEYAGKAGYTEPFLLSKQNERDVGKYLWSRENTWEAKEVKRTPQKVGTKAPNTWGLHDMQGNVLEWCNNQFYRYVARLGEEKKVVKVNPPPLSIPESYDYHERIYVMSKGGCIINQIPLCVVSWRHWNHGGNAFTGFRFIERE